MLDGAVEFTFRSGQTVARAGAIRSNIPAKRRISSATPSTSRRGYCACARLAGQDEYSLRVGDRLDGPTSPPPALTEEEQPSAGTGPPRWPPTTITELLIG